MRATDPADRLKRVAGSLASGSRSAVRAGKSVADISRTAARASAAAASGTSRAVHRMSGASGAGRTGLSHLIEFSAASSAGDAFVAVALAGTLFFSTSVTQARGRVALALLITMAPFALLAPFIGPMLDRLTFGRRFILVGTVLARSMLCWGMSGAVQHNDTVTLLPAAFGVLLLQKAFGVTRASVTPALLPSEITLVTANARCALASLIASTVGVPVAAGLSLLLGGGSGGATWVLRVGTVVYLAAIVPAIRLPSRVDGPVPADDAEPDRSPRPAERRSGAGRWRLFPRPIGPVVAEAMVANVSLRAYSGFLIFFLAFILRTVHFGTVSDKLALGALVAAAAIGGFAGTAVGAALRARAPRPVIHTTLAISAVIAALSAMYFGLSAALIVAFAAAAGQTLVKLALDSVVQREISPEVRSSTFAASETLHQLSWVAGGLAGLALSITGSGVAGLSVAATGLVASLGYQITTRRLRLSRNRAELVTEPAGAPDPSSAG
jgi:MFS family permease